MKFSAARTTSNSNLGGELSKGERKRKEEKTIGATTI